MAKKTEKKGFFAQMMEDSRADKDRFTRSVSEGKNYETLYDIGSSIRRIDTTNLLIGVMAILLGLMIFMFSIVWPFLTGQGFRMGFWTAMGMMILLSGLFYYIGAYRVLHPLSVAVSVRKDEVIRGILKERIVVYEREDEEHPEYNQETDP